MDLLAIALKLLCLACPQLVVLPLTLLVCLAAESLAGTPQTQPARSNVDSVII